MADEASDHSGEQNVPPPRRLRRPRSPTVLLEVMITASNERRRVEFDENIPVGQYATQFGTFLGTVTRNRLNILINNWREIHKDDKNQCWLDVLVSL